VDILESGRVFHILNIQEAGSAADPQQRAPVAAAHEAQYMPTEQLGTAWYGERSKRMHFRHSMDVSRHVKKFRRLRMELKRLSMIRAQTHAAQHAGECECCMPGQYLLWLGRRGKRKSYLADVSNSSHPCT